MKHHILAHNVGRRYLCRVCKLPVLIGHHYFSATHRSGLFSSQTTSYWHEGHLVDAHGDPMPCPDKAIVLRVGLYKRNGTPKVPVQPLELVEGK